jgi:hypothetical protein
VTPAEHADQRNRVAASLYVDDARMTHHTVYPVRGRETGLPVAHAPVHVRYPRLVMVAARVYAYSRTGRVSRPRVFGRWS